MKAIARMTDNTIAVILLLFLSWGNVTSFYYWCMIIRYVMYILVYLIFSPIYFFRHKKDNDGLCKTVSEWLSMALCMQVSSLDIIFANSLDPDQTLTECQGLIWDQTA